MFSNLGLPDSFWPFKKDSMSWNHLTSLEEDFASVLVYAFQHFHFAVFPEDADFFLLFLG